MFPYSQLITPCKGVLSPESTQFSRGIWNTAQGIWIPLTTETQNPTSTAKESGINGVESRIQNCLGLPYVGWNERYNGYAFGWVASRASFPVMASEASSKRKRDRAANISFLSPGPHTRVSFRVRLSPDFSQLFQMAWRECSQAGGYVKVVTDHACYLFHCCPLCFAVHPLDIL